MRRVCFFLFIVVLLVGTVSAQNRGGWRGGSSPVTVDGTLKLERGVVAVASGDNVYFVPLLTRYIGFIDGLKEGNRISVEGYTLRNFLQPSKVTINGKSYDFPVKGYGNGWRGNGYGPGHGRQDRHGPYRGGRGGFRQGRWR